MSSSADDGRTLHDPQRIALARLLTRVWAGAREVMLAAPTGSGKTLLLCTALSILTRQRRRPFRGALIVAPTLEIVANFDERDVVRFGGIVEGLGDAAAHNDKAILTFPPINLAETMGAPLRDQASVLSHLTREANYRGAVRVTTTSMLANTLRAATVEGRTLALDDFVVAFDEIHHAPYVDGEDDIPERSWAWCRQETLRCGAVTLGSSATLYRADGQLVCSDGALDQDVVEIPRDDLILAGLCPRNLRVKLVAMPPLEDAKGETDPSSQIAKYSKRARTREILHLLQQWVMHGCPKAVFRFVDHVNHRAASEEAWRLLLEMEGPRIEAALGRAPRDPLHVWGLGPARMSPEDRARLVHDQRVKRWEDVGIDVVFGCRMVQEGFNWPPCSHVYNLGFPSSSVLTIQLHGRAAREKRRKIAGYPEDFVEEACLYLCVPTLDDEAAETLLNSPKTRRILLSLMAVMASEQRSYDLMPLHMRLREALMPLVRSFRDRVELEERLRSFTIDPVLREEAKLVLAGILSFLRERGRTTTKTEIFKELERQYSREDYLRLRKPLAYLYLELGEGPLHVDLLPKSDVAPPLESGEGRTPPENGEDRDLSGKKRRRLPTCEAILEMLANLLDRTDEAIPDLIVNDMGQKLVTLNITAGALAHVRAELWDSTDRNAFLATHDFHVVAALLDNLPKWPSPRPDRDLSHVFGTRRGIITSAWLDHVLAAGKLREQPAEVRSLGHLRRWRQGLR